MHPQQRCSCESYKYSLQKSDKSVAETLEAGEGDQSQNVELQPALTTVFSRLGIVSAFLFSWWCGCNFLVLPQMIFSIFEERCIGYPTIFDTNLNISNGT